MGPPENPLHAMFLRLVATRDLINLTAIHDYLEDRRDDPERRWQYGVVRAAVRDWWVANRGNRVEARAAAHTDNPNVVMLVRDTALHWRTLVGRLAEALHFDMVSFPDTLARMAPFVPGDTVLRASPGTAGLLAAVVADYSPDPTPADLAILTANLCDVGDIDTDTRGDL